jgi:hypothetical protein
MRTTRRAGTTLIETVVLGTLVSLTLTTMSMFTHLLLKSSHQIADRGQVRSAVARLQEHFDRDAANAPFAASEANNGETLWRSVLPDGKQVEYRSALRTVDRQVLDSAGQVQQRDQFRLPPTYRFAPSKEASGDVAIEIKVEQEQALKSKEESAWHPAGLRIVVTSHRRTEPELEKQP